jgi:UDP-3-O-[3-hydroxymyristoyl] N-acetylglucosamine deacetylase/3-hydroxyacyl-[acyl-carrier-protein] dehydratase
VRGEASLEGVGIHTGARTKLTFRAAPSGAGIAFRRTDLASQPVIPARLSSVGALERRTALTAGGAEVHTVEHVLAAVAALEIDDLLVDITGPEPPILDARRVVPAVSRGAARGPAGPERRRGRRVHREGSLQHQRR